MTKTQLLTRLFSSNKLEQLSEELYGHYSIDNDDRYEHEGNHYRISRFLVAGMYYTVCKTNGNLTSIGKG